jgi:hypothetical protein
MDAPMAYICWNAFATKEQFMQRKQSRRKPKIDFKALRAKSPPCPRCQIKDDVVPIFYGLPVEYPAPMSRERLENSEWGGCIVTGNDPAYLCRKCGLKFG